VNTPEPTDGVTPAELGAETAGMFLLMLIGLLREAWAGTDPNAAGPDGIAWVWGAGVVIACYAVRKVSGAHINPAVTVALAALGDFPWRKVPGYCLAQVFGAFLAAWVIRILYAQRINQVDPGHTIATQGVFSTLPGPGAGLWVAFANEALGTGLLVAALLWLLDLARREHMIADFEPLLIGAVVAFLGMTVGGLSTWAINPARDLGPRIVTAMSGYATAWQDQHGQPYWWVPIFGPLTGGLVVAGGWRVYRWHTRPRAPEVGSVLPPPRRAGFELAEPTVPRPELRAATELMVHLRTTDRRFWTVLGLGTVAALTVVTLAVELVLMLR